MLGWKLCGFSLLILGLVVACLLGSTATVCASSFENEQLFGGTQDDIAAQIIQTTDNGCVILGTTHSYGAGNADFWLIKLDQNTNPQWNYTYGGTQGDTAKTVVQTSDGGFIVAGTTASFGVGNSSFWLIKVDSLGNLQWNQTYGTTTCELDCMIQINDNGYALVGRTTQNSTFFLWLVKTDQNGNTLWNQTVTKGTVNAAIQTRDGGFLFAGTKNYPDQNYVTDAWLIKTDPHGNPEWNQTYDLEQGFDYATNLVQNKDGTYTFAGMTGGFFFHRLWVVNVNSTGSMLWNTIFDTPETAYCTSLTKTSDQGYTITGCTDSLDLPNHTRYLVLVKLDQNGNVQYNQTHNNYPYYKNAYPTQTNNQTYALAATVKTDENTDYNILFFTTTAQETIPEFSSITTAAMALTVMILAATLYQTKLNKSERS